MRSSFYAGGLFFLLGAAGVYSAEPLTPGPGTCSGGMLIADANLTVQPSGDGAPKPLRKVNQLKLGYRVHYSPISLPQSNPKKAEVSLVLFTPGNEKITVLGSKRASEPAQWTVPARASVAALMYGPQGLDEKKVSKVDPQLMAQLADYADKTTQTETLIEALKQYDHQANRGSENLEAALVGFSSRFGAANVRLDKNQPLDQQAGILLGTLNPALSSYDPLAQQSSMRLQQSAGLAASVATLFFGNTVGLAAGGTSMLLNMRTLMFPNVEFRSSFAQSSDSQRLTLCAKPEAKSRTKIGYLWATRLPDSGPPIAALTSAQHVAHGLKSKLPLNVNQGLLARATQWSLQTADGQAFPVPVIASGKDLEIDLGSFGGKAGTYTLNAFWDWEPLKIQGEVHVHDLPSMSGAVPSPASRDRLIEKAGLVPLTLEGEDFEFVQKATLRPAEGRAAAQIDLPLLPHSPGPLRQLDLEIDTRRLERGNYLIALYQPGGPPKDVEVRVLPPNPALTDLPLRANSGETTQLIPLKGERLDRIQRITSNGFEVALVRTAEIHALQVSLPPSAKPGQQFDLEMKVEGVEQPLLFAKALEVVGPRPVIRSVSLSVPGNLGVGLKERELPAGSFSSFSIFTSHVRSHATVHLQCAEEATTLQPIHLRTGEQQPSARAERASSDTTFLSLEPGAIGPVGCTVTATVSTDDAGTSEPVTLGSVVRLPRIESFELTSEDAGNGAYIGLLKGMNLETVEKAGWDASNGLSVKGLPSPIAGEGAKQMLRIALPWPPPAPRTPVHVWLRGERGGRVTDARY